MKSYKWYTILFIISVIHPILGQIPLPTLPNLQSIVAYEATNGIFTHTFGVADPKLYQRLGTSLSTTNDFGGVPGAENYDIFFSDATGQLDPVGSYITIECRYLGTSGGGGCNITHLELAFNNGFKISSQILSSFYGTGANFLPATVSNAVDCNPNTSTTMGNNSATPNTVFLRLTFDFSSIIEETLLTACSGSGFEYKVNSQVFNESNPAGTAYATTSNGCNRLEIVEIVFEPTINIDLNYSGCVGDNYKVNVAGIVFDEKNPKGIISIPSLITCDTIYSVNLKFNVPPAKAKEITTCDENFMLSIGGQIFNLQNPEGTVKVPGSDICDTIYNIKISFVKSISKFSNYDGCAGDRYSINIAGNLFDESNPKGEVTILGNQGCDTIYYVSLIYKGITTVKIHEDKCLHENYSLKIGDVIFNADNPIGIMMISPDKGCDTIYDIRLIFQDCELECLPHAPNIISSYSNYNNIFEIKYREFCELSNTNLRIYDRWGNLIHHDTNPIWDGTFNGTACETGVYAYLFDYMIFGKHKYLSGNITVIK